MTPLCVLAAVLLPVSVTLNAPVIPRITLRQQNHDASIAPPEAVNVIARAEEWPVPVYCKYPH